MKRLLCSVAAVLAGLHAAGAFATNYFVDAAVGNDSFTGQAPQVMSATVGPWRTLNRVKTASLQPGDAVWFRCGQSWRGNLRVASSPDPARPIRYSRFGDNCTAANKPVITAAAALSGWQHHAGNVYVADTWFRVYQLFANGVTLRLAQHPNPGYQAQPSARGLFVVDGTLPSPNHNLTIVDSELGAIANHDLVGAGLHVRVNDYIIDDRQVVAFDPANLVVTLNERTRYPIRADWGYYLDNKLWMLDEPGEFYFDGSNPDRMRVYVWMPDGAAPGSRVVGSTNAYGIDATGATNVLIEALRIEKTGTGIAMGGSTNVVVRNTDIADSYHRGISANGARNAVIENSTVSRSVREGILAGTATDSRIVGNVVIDSGVVGPPIESRGGISSTGDGMVIKNNVVVNSGYHGIGFGKRSDISNNRIENACLVLNDCGGLYTGNSPAGNDASRHDSIVMGNTITGVYGNTNGRDPGPTHDLTPGIYLDFRTHGVYVAGNTVSRTDMGLFLHAASDNSIIDNTFYDYETQAIRIREHSFAPITIPNRIRQNRFFGLKEDQRPIMLSPVNDNVSTLATWDFNSYSALYAADPATLGIARINLLQNGRWTDRFLDIQQWRQAGNDTSGIVFDRFSILPVLFQPVNGVNLITNGSFDSDVSSWLAYAPQGDAAIGWTTNCPAPGCARLTRGSQSPSGSLISGAFPVEPGKSYAVTFSNRAGQQSFTSRIVPRMAGPSSYVQFDDKLSVTAATTWRTHGVIFTVPSDLVFRPGDRGARVDFTAPPGQTLFLDDVRVEEVTATTNSPADDSQLLVNPTAFAMTFGCPDLISAPHQCSEYVYFPDGGPVNWPVTLPPRKSAIVIWGGNPFIRP